MRQNISDWNCFLRHSSSGQRPSDEVIQQVSAGGPREVVTDKGYHSRAVVSELTQWGVRTYCSEPDRGRQRWSGQEREQQAVCANRRRIGGERGRRLLRQRGEKLELWNQHLYDRGGMRRVHLRGRENILKRLVVHSGAANLGLLMRKLFGKGTGPSAWPVRLWFDRCLHRESPDGRAHNVAAGTDLNRHQSFQPDVLRPRQIPAVRRNCLFSDA